MGERGDNEYSVQLYRAVSQEELDDIALFHGFRPGSGCMETKLFATSAADAAFFAREILYPLDNKPLTIVEVDHSSCIRKPTLSLYDRWEARCRRRPRATA